MPEYEDSKMESDSNIKQTTVAGQSATAIVDPAAEAAYWSENYLKRGYDQRERPFRDVEGDLEQGWEQVKGDSALTWIQARYAVSDAWHRAGRPAPVEPAPA